MNYYDSLLESYSLLKKRKFKLSLIEEGATPEEKEKGAQDAIAWLDNGGGKGGGKNGDLTGIASTNKEGIPGIEVTGGAFTKYAGFFAREGKGWSQTKGSKKGPGNPVEAGAKANSGAAKLVAAFTLDGSTDTGWSQDLSSKTDIYGRKRSPEELADLERKGKEAVGNLGRSPEELAELERAVQAANRLGIAQPLPHRAEMLRDEAPYDGAAGELGDAVATGLEEKAEEEARGDEELLQDKLDTIPPGLLDPIFLANLLVNHAINSTVWAGRDPDDLNNAMTGANAVIALGRDIQNKPDEDHTHKINELAETYDMTVDSDGCVRFRGLSLTMCTGAEPESAESHLSAYVTEMGKLMRDRMMADIASKGKASEADSDLSPDDEAKKKRQEQGGGATTRGSAMEQAYHVLPEIDKCIKLMAEEPPDTTPETEEHSFWRLSMNDCADFSTKVIFQKMEDYKNYQAACLEKLRINPKASCKDLKDKKGKPLPKGANYAALVGVFRRGILGEEEKWMFVDGDDEWAQKQTEFMVKQLVAGGRDEKLVRKFIERAAGIVRNEDGTVTYTKPNNMQLIFISVMALRGVYDAVHGDLKPTRTEETGAGQDKASNVLGAKMDLKDIYCLEVEEGEDEDAALEAKREELKKHVLDNLISEDQKNHYEKACPTVEINDLLNDLLPIEEQECDGPDGKKQKRKVVTFPREPKTQGESKNSATLGEQSMAKNAAAFDYVCNNTVGSLKPEEIRRIHDIMDQMELGELCGAGKGGDAGTRKTKQKEARAELEDVDDKGQPTWNNPTWLPPSGSVKNACDFNTKIVEDQQKITDLLEGGYVEGLDRQSSAIMTLDAVVESLKKKKERLEKEKGYGILKDKETAGTLTDKEKDRLDTKRGEEDKLTSDMSAAEKDLAAKEAELKEYIKAARNNGVDASVKEMEKNIEEYKGRGSDEEKKAESAKKCIEIRYGPNPKITKDMSKKQKEDCENLQKIISTVHTDIFKKHLDDSLGKGVDEAPLTGEALAYAQFQYAITAGAISEVLNEKIGLDDNRATSGMRNAEIAANMSNAKFIHTRQSPAVTIVAEGAKETRARLVFELESGGKALFKTQTGNDPTLMHEFYDADTEEELKAGDTKKQKEVAKAKKGRDEAQKKLNQRKKKSEAKGYGILKAKKKAGTLTAKDKIDLDAKTAELDKMEAEEDLKTALEKAEEDLKTAEDAAEKAKELDPHREVEEGLMISFLKGQQKLLEVLLNQTT